MPLLSPKSLAGPGYIVLNVLRAMNIIGLLAVICASLVMLVKTVIASNLFFFDAVSHVITACVSTFLIVSEASLFRSYFAKNWPLLSPTHGFVTLGLAMLVLGVNILGNLNKEATSQKNLGLAFWRIVIGSGILITILGFFNMVASYIFRDPAAKVTARQVRAKGAVAINQQHIYYQPGYSNKASSLHTTSTTSTTSTNPTVGHNISKLNAPYPLSTHTTGNTKSAANTTRPSTAEKSHRFSRFKPRNILPSYHERSHPPPASSYYGDDDAERHHEMQISAPMNTNPQFSHLVPQFATMKRPDSVLHPARANRY